MRRLHLERFAVLFLCLTISFGVSAQSVSCGKTAVYFGNGMWTDESTEARDSSNKLQELLRQRMNQTEFAALDDPFYIANNPTQSKVRDLIEALAQQNISDYTQIWRWVFQLDILPVSLRPFFQGVFRSAIRNDLTGLIDPTVLKKHTDDYKAIIASGKKVLVVAHSQGNFFANQAYPSLTQQFQQDAFGMLAVASPDTHVEKPGSPYVTLFGDGIITGLVQAERLLLLKPPALFPNTTNFSTPLTTGDWTGHEFIKSYLESGSSSETKIADRAKQTIQGLTTPPCPPTPNPTVVYGGFTATITQITNAGTVSAPSDIQVGSPVVVRFSYNPSAATVLGSTTSHADYLFFPTNDPFANYSASIGGHSWKLDRSDPNSAYQIRESLNWFANSMYQSTLEIDGLSSTPTNDPAAPDGVVYTYLGHYPPSPTPYTSNVLNSTALPRSLSDLNLSVAAAPARWLTLYAAKNKSNIFADSYRIDAVIDLNSFALATVPAPTYSTVFGNLGGVQSFDPFTYSSYSVVYNDPTRSPPNWEEALSFTTQSRFYFDGVAMPLALSHGTPALDVTLTTDVAGSPGVSIEAMRYTGAFAPLFQPVPLAFVSSLQRPVLQANTRYWLVLTAPGPAATDISVFVSPLSETNEFQLFRSPDLGGNWNCIVPCFNSKRMAFEVRGTPN